MICSIEWNTMAKTIMTGYNRTFVEILCESSLLLLPNLSLTMYACNFSPKKKKLFWIIMIFIFTPLLHSCLKGKFRVIFVLCNLAALFRTCFKLCVCVEVIMLAEISFNLIWNVSKLNDYDVQARNRCFGKMDNCFKYLTITYAVYKQFKHKFENLHYTHWMGTLSKCGWWWWWYCNGCVNASNYD